jgi:hypothetical protein
VVHLEFGNVGFKQPQLLGKLKVLNSKECSGGLSSSERDLRGIHLLDLENLAHLETTSWRQKSQVLWLKEGDNNTKFFHKITNSNRRLNFMEKIEVEGTTYHTDSDIREKVIQFYESLYTEQESWRPFVDDLPFSVIDDFDRTLLDSCFERDEIIQVVRDLQGDQSPGPDGFNMAFFQKCWRVVESDVMAFLRRFMSMELLLIPLMLLLLLLSLKNGMLRTLGTSDL